MTDSAETMREALKEARDTLEALRKQLHGEPFAQNRDRWLNLGMRTVDAIKKADAALSASGTKSDGGAEVASSAAPATRGEQRDRTHGMMPIGDNAETSACTDRSPSDPIPSQLDEREAIAEQLQGWADFIDTEAAQSMSVASAAYANGGSLADDLRSAILAMLAERRDFTCAARKQSLPEPADCDWPVCGCDPYADKVIAALEESGALKDQSQHPAPIAGLEPVAWEYRWPDGEYTWTRRKPSCLDGYHPRYSAAQLEAHAAEQVRAEREACARIADDWRVSKINNGDLTNEQLNQLLNGIGPNIAAAIRARGQV